MECLIREYNQVYPKPDQIAASKRAIRSPRKEQRSPMGLASPVLDSTVLENNIDN